MERDLGGREQMFSMIGLWQQSGLTQKAFCAQHDIVYHVFHYWYKRFRLYHAPSKPEGFISIKIDAQEVSAAELLLPDGKRLLFHQPVSSSFLKALIS